MKQVSLSKTAYMEGLRCPRLLWLKTHMPSLQEPIDPTSAYLFFIGHKTEGYARQLFSGGTMIENGGNRNFSALLDETQRAIESSTPYIYEGTFAARQMRCRADILHRGSRNRWNLAEIKIATRVDPTYILDTGFQCACIESAGYTVNRIHLVHVNKSYIRHGGIDPSQMLVSEEITDSVIEEKRKVPERMASLVKMLEQSEPPTGAPGSRCMSPGRCQYKHFCEKEIPYNSIYEIPYGRKLISRLLEKGITRLVDVPNDIPLTPRQAVLIKSAKTGKPVINRSAIRQFLSELKFPLFSLDYETLCLMAIPAFENSSCWEPLPFMYSLSVLRKKGGPIEHYEFLAESAKDPRPQICERLLNELGNKGTILAWNATYEKTVITESLAKRFPEYAEGLQTLLPRFKDPIVLFRNGDYGDARMRGSASLKKVLPVMVPSMSYTGTIANGQDASLAFQKLVDGNMTEEEWKNIRPALLSYCQADSTGCLLITTTLQDLV